MKRSHAYLALAVLGLASGVFKSLGQSSSADSARAETPGPCSRRSPLVISEIMYHPPERPDSNNLEFIEVYNSQLWPEDMSGFQLAGAVQYTFPTGTVLAAEGVVVVAGDLAALRNVYGITNVLGPFTGRLENQGEQVRLLNRAGAVLLGAAYSAEPPWPVAADGAGHSLVLSRPSWGEGDARAWAASDVIGGSPGRMESIGAETLRDVMINELAAHTTDPEPDFIELYNHSNQPADLSGVHLTDNPTTNKFTFVVGTTIEPRGFLALDQTQLGFALSSGGETIYLINSNGTRVLDAVRFGAQARDVSFGRSPDGSTLWSELAGKTPGTSNSPALVRDIVINEIMYAPLSGGRDAEFVELYNRGATAVDLSGWRFLAGIEFTFPTNTSIAADGYMVVARNAARLLTNYPNLSRTNVVGDFAGRLSGSGERIALAMPETVTNINQGQLETSVHHIVVDEVTYGTGGRWGPQAGSVSWADGGGSSLELIDPRSDNRLAANWGDSDETAKGDWTLVEFTGRLDNGDGTAANSLQVLLMGAGECLLDEVEVIGPAGTNVLANPSFESGLSPWTPQGDHETSFLQATGGANNSRCLHIRAGSDGDPGANRIRVPLTTSLPLNTNATLRAEVRWLRGHPEILLRLGGNYLEAFGRLAVPSNLGTPGARNSRAVSNAGPAIFDVRHEPVLPAANQPVLVTARLDDPDGLGETLVRYRIEPGTNTVWSVPLLDDGTGGDAVAGDGLFSATIPGQPPNVLVAFHIVASDHHAQAATNRFPSDAPTRECLVRFGESQPAGRFAAYRLWITQATFNNWTSRLKLHNAGLDGTFAYGNQRVLYNVGARYAGSAYHASRYTSPTGVACDYKLDFPVDDPFLGSDEATVVWPGLTGGDPVDFTAQQEQTSYWIASTLGLPFNYQRYVHFFVNGVRRSFIMQDTQKPDSDLLRQWFPDDPDGDFFKIQIWREYDAAVNNTTTIGATLGNFTTTGGAKKTARYRWAWTPRAAAGTMNDFADLFDLVDAVNSPSNTYTASVEAVVDIEQWMRTFAAEHIVANWDSYGYGNGQNMYAYKPDGDRWKMMMWDIDVCLGNASDQPTDDLFKLTNPYFPFLNGDPAVVGRMYQHPKFARAYWRAVQEAVDGPLLSSNLNALLDAKAAAFTANGISASSPANIKTFLSSRRNYCIGRLGTVAANFAVNTPASLTTSNNLVLLSGTAPVNVRDIIINGVPFPVTWTSVTSWIATVVVNTGTNELVAQGLDRVGQPISSARWTNTVICTGPSATPAGTIAINEIMYHPVVPGAAYVELLNTSSNVSFDLGNWRLNGLGFTFPPGSILTSGQHLVLAQDRWTFAATYGSNLPVFAEFPGNLQLDGETLTLFRPGSLPGEEIVVDKVRYEAVAPWSASANGQGASLQLIDPAQDHSRVSNWSEHPPLPFTPGARNSQAGELPPYPPLWLNEVQPNNLNGIADRAGHRQPWVELYNAGATALSLDGLYLARGYDDLTIQRFSDSTNVWRFPSGASLAAGEFKIIWVDGAPGETAADEWHTAFRLDALLGSVALVRLVDNAPQIVDYLNYRGVAADQCFGAIPDGQPFERRVLFIPTPSQSNTSAAPAIVVFINEWMASNVGPGGYRNPVGGNYDDWFELYNPGPDAADLTGCALTDTLDDPSPWIIPAGYTIAPRRFLLVWADGQPSRNSTNHPDLHVNFRLARTADAIYLLAPNGRQIDAVTFVEQTSNVSEGRFPDGASSFYFMTTATPGTSNVVAATNTFAVTGIQRSSNGDLVLSWQTIHGKTYRVEYKNDLNEQQWAPLGGDYMASGASLSILDPVGDIRQRFYRILQVD